VLTRADLAADAPHRPVYVLGGNGDSGGTAYRNPPTWELGGNRRPDLVNGTVGRRAAEDAFRTAGLAPTDVDVCEFYDPFSFEIIRQYEAFGFCAEGEGGDFVTSGAIEPGGRYPVTTDGGVMSYSHAGASAQMLQRVIRGVEQLRGACATNQVAGAEVAMCSNGGSGALFTDVMLLGADRP
jgi:acetyl-CoA acetyltransferase